MPIFREDSNDPSIEAYSSGRQVWIVFQDMVVCGRCATVAAHLDLSSSPFVHQRP
jgi:hypothetical protein